MEVFTVETGKETYRAPEIEIIVFTQTAAEQDVISSSRENESDIF